MHGAVVMGIFGAWGVGIMKFLKEKSPAEKFELWKAKLARLLSEHPDIKRGFTGAVELQMSEGGVTRIFVNKRIPADI
jgi:hypothetical protein